LNARITVLDQSKQSIEHDLFLEQKKCEEISESKDSEIRSLQEKLRTKVNEYSVDVDIKAAEIESLNDQLNAKNAFISKLEQNLQADTSRLEKKLSTQVNRFTVSPCVLGFFTDFLSFI
jgi:chromosome segregation ATPase